MQSKMDELEKAKRFTVYKNGDRFFSGARVTLNRKKVANLDKLFDILTQQIHANDAVRRLCTPLNGTRIRSLDDIADDGVYVAVGNARFAKFGYTSIGKDERRHYRQNNKENYDQPFQASQPTPRHFLEPVNIISIRVFANGKEFDNDHRVILTRHMLQNWNTVLTEVSSKVRPLTGAAKSLYTLDGQRVKAVEELVSGQTYVVVGTELGGFQKLDYGRRKPVFNLSPKLARRYYLQPLDDSSATSSKKSSGKSGATMFSDEDEDVDYHGDHEPAVPRRQVKRLVVNGSKPKRDSSLNDDYQKQQKQKQQQEEEEVDAGDITTAGNNDDDVFHAKPGRSQPKKQALNFEQGQDDVFHTKNSPSEGTEAKTVGERLDTEEQHQPSPNKRVAGEKVKSKKAAGTKKVAATSKKNASETTAKTAAVKQVESPLQQQSKPKVKVQVRSRPDSEEAEDSSRVAETANNHRTGNDNEDVYEALPAPEEDNHDADQQLRYRRDNSLRRDSESAVVNGNGHDDDGEKADEQGRHGAAVHDHHSEDYTDGAPKSTSRDSDREYINTPTRPQESSPRHENQEEEAVTDHRVSPGVDEGRVSRSPPPELRETVGDDDGERRNSETLHQRSPSNGQLTVPRTPTPPQHSKSNRGSPRSVRSPAAANNDVRPSSQGSEDNRGQGQLPLPRTPEAGEGEGEEGGASSTRDGGASRHSSKPATESEHRQEEEEEGDEGIADAEQADDGKPQSRSAGRQSREDHSQSPRDPDTGRVGQDEAN